MNIRKWIIALVFLIAGGFAFSDLNAQPNPAPGPPENPGGGRPGGGPPGRGPGGPPQEKRSNHIGFDYPTDFTSQDFTPMGNNHNRPDPRGTLYLPGLPAAL